MSMRKTPIEITRAMRRLLKDASNEDLHPRDRMFAAVAVDVLQWVSGVEHTDTSKVLSNKEEGEG